MLSSIKLLKKPQNKQYQLFSLLRQVIKTVHGILFLYGLICYVASEVEKAVMLKLQTFQVIFISKHASLITLILEKRVPLIFNF